MPKGFQRNCNYPMVPLIKDLATLWMAKRVEFPYRCGTCGKGYQHRATLVRHTRHECGKEPQFKCPYCVHRTKQRGNLYQHIRTNHPGKNVFSSSIKYSCSRCLKSYKRKYRKSNSKRHISRKHSNDRDRELILWEDYQVFDPATVGERCLYETSYFASDRKSVRVFRSKRADPVAGRYKCSKCSKSYRWKHHLVEHVKASCGQKKAECCPYCSYRSNRNTNYSSSNWTVPTLPSTSRVVAYTRHLRSMNEHGGKVRRWGPRKYLCTDCNRNFELMASLTRHRIFECNKQAIASERGVQDQPPAGERRHLLRRHNIYLPPKFSVPKRIFAQYFPECKQDYRMYLKCLPPLDLANTNASAPFHPGMSCTGDPRLLFQRNSSSWIPETDKPYMCTNCGKGYTHIFTLNRHRRTVCGKVRNTNGKWKCARCSRSYVTEGNLVRHVKFECGVRRKFCCIFCNRKFTQRCSLIRHLRNFHNESIDSSNSAIPPEYPPMDTCQMEVKKSEDTATVKEEFRMCIAFAAISRVCSLKMSRRSEEGGGKSKPRTEVNAKLGLLRSLIGVRVTKRKYLLFASIIKGRLFCDQLPRDIWRRCKDELLCLKCAKRYSDWRSLRKHMNFFCQMCLGGCLSGQQLDDSLAPDQSGKPVFVCPKCGKGYTWKASLQRHLSTGCGLPPMFCCVWNVAGYVDGYSPAAVDSLQQQLHPEFDKFKISTSSSSVQPMSNCHKRHMCGFCKKVFPLKNLLRRHVQFGCKMNPRNSQFACSICPYKSTYKANMERHVRNVHDTGVLKFRCDLCNFRSNYSFCVRRHMKTFHPSLWPYKTIYAFERMNDRVARRNDREQQLRQGGNSDIRERSFVCVDCGKAYVVHRSLWRHRKFECVNAKPKFTCEVCPYKSPHKWCIENHKKRHHTYRKMYMGDQVIGYTCTMCSKFYKMWSNYLKHKCEPPQFKCQFCPFAAFKAFILHAHQAEQHFKVTSPNT
ncbi:Zinc finger protein Xfin [Habropoda laboriosa]|uniref:Zinc finger protein Xfin n=1 Tax=Habropoda laboriosa TaxID=597456 RepID=A0A0L7RAT1_9HYME|nr:Zinc finger protein Xfin [Habropoda laboriosa]